MNSTEIQRGLFWLFDKYEYKLQNTYIFGWESDFLAISKSGYSIEVEVKISKSDFLADFKKTTANRRLKHDVLLDVNSVYKPNKFYFACPSGLINKSDICDEYGLIWVDVVEAKVIKEPKFLHKTKLLESKKFLKSLLDKFYYRNIDLKKELRLKDYDIKFGQKIIDIRY